MKINLYENKNSKFQSLYEKNRIKNDTMNESELRRVYNYPTYPRTSKICSNRGFVNIDNGSQGGTHWTCFVVKDTKSYYDSFGGAPDKFLLNE